MERDRNERDRDREKESQGGRLSRMIAHLSRSLASVTDRSPIKKMLGRRTRDKARRGGRREREGRRKGDRETR